MPTGVIAITVLAAFILLMLTGIPVGYGIGGITLLSFALLNGDPSIIPQKLFAGADVYSYLCILLFILAADIMSIGGITYSLVRFCETLIGHVKGGLAHVNTLASMLFAGLSGSATADACGLGPIEIDLMVRGGYPRDFSTCVTAATAIIGPIIPPSNIMIIFATCAGTISIGKMFAGGILPGILLGICYMAYCYIISGKRGYPRREKRASVREILLATKDTLPALFLPVMIFTFITFGIATATETSACAVLYAIIVATARKQMSFRSFYRSCIRAAKSTASVMFIIAISNAMGWAITTMGLAQVLQEFFLTHVSSKYVFLLFVNLLLIVIGMLLDASPALLMTVPILYPIAMAYHIDPVHFGVMVCLNLMIGNITPPVGMMLFVCSNVGKVSLSTVYRKIWPFCITAFVALALVTFFPPLTTFLPGLLF